MNPLVFLEAPETEEIDESEVFPISSCQRSLPATCANPALQRRL